MPAVAAGGITFIFGPTAACIATGRHFSLSKYNLPDSGAVHAPEKTLLRLKQSASLVDRHPSRQSTKIILKVPQESQFH